MINTSDIDDGEPCCSSSIIGDFKVIHSTTAKIGFRKKKQTHSYSKDIKSNYDYESKDTNNCNNVDISEEDHSIALWKPSDAYTDEMLDKYMHVVTSMKLVTEDQALALLYYHKGDIEKALKDLENCGNFFDNGKNELVCDKYVELLVKEHILPRQFIPDNYDINEKFSKMLVDKMSTQNSLMNAICVWESQREQGIVNAKTKSENLRDNEKQKDDNKADKSKLVKEENKNPSFQLSNVNTQLEPQVMDIENPYLELLSDKALLMCHQQGEITDPKPDCEYEVARSLADLHKQTEINKIIEDNEAEILLVCLTPIAYEPTMEIQAEWTKEDKTILSLSYEEFKNNPEMLSFIIGTKTPKQVSDYCKSIAISKNLSEPKHGDD